MPKEWEVLKKCFLTPPASFPNKKKYLFIITHCEYNKNSITKNNYSVIIIGNNYRSFFIVF